MFENEKYPESSRAKATAKSDRSMNDSGTDLYYVLKLILLIINIRRSAGNCAISRMTSCAVYVII